MKYFYDTCQGRYSRERLQAEVKAQRDYEYQLRIEARKTVERLRREGRRVVVHYSNSYIVASRGLCVMPNPRLTPDGYLAWTCR